MRLARASTWLYPAIPLAFGIVFLIGSLTQAGAADEYSRAPQCGNTVAPSCYEVLTGTIKSVQVSQSRWGERDDVVIETASAGTLSVTLKPSATTAPHVRTGASVTVKRYRGEVTLIGVDGYGVASTKDPVSNQSDASSVGWLFIAIGLAGGAIVLYTRRRRSRRAAAGAIDTSATYSTTADILPSGSVGWSVRPHVNFSTLARYGFAAVALPLFSIRALADPARTVWAVLFDSTIVVAVAVPLWLFFRNSTVFADKEQVGKVNLWGRTKTLSLHDVRRAERFSVQDRYGAVKHLVFVGPDGRKAFEVAGSAWDFDHLDAMCQEVGIQLGGSYEEAVSAFRLNARVPGITTWGQQLLIALGLFAVIIPFLILIIGPGRR